MDQANTENEKPARKVWKLIRPKEFKIADEATLHRILNPPPRFPKPEFKRDEYINGPQNDSEYIFMCNEPGCTAKFTTAVGLTLHKNKHLDPNIRCKFCGLLFKTNDNLLQHCIEFHPDLDKYPDANPLQCKKCNKISRDKKALWRHVRESHRERNWPCPHCNFPFTRPENLKQHLQTHHNDNAENMEKQVCKICKKEYKDRISLRQHIRHVHREKPEASYRCVICKTVYFNLQVYKQHMSRHVNPKFYPCHICKVKFKNISHLKRHQACKVHIKQARKVGKLLNVIDLVPAPVIKTVKTANLDLSKEELITLCKTVSLKIILHRADEEIAVQSIATEDKRKIGSFSGSDDDDDDDKDSKDAEVTAAGPYLNCLYCEQQLPDLQTVQSHEKVCHKKPSNPTLVMCPVCDKEFDKPFKLKLHSLKHSNVKAHKCSYCDSTFKSARTRINHEKYAHFDIRYQPKVHRVFRCNYKGCGKQYASVKTLHEHIASVHIGVRVSCDKCGRSFKQEKNLAKHLKTVHVECPTLLECKACKRKYKDRVQYLTHLKRERHWRKTREYE